MFSELLEQQEKLRRVVDEWRIRSHDLLGDLGSDPYIAASPALATSVSDPIHLHVEPIEHSHLSELLKSDNVDVSKFIMVLSYDCIEISNLSNLASKNLYRQLLLFGHRSSPQEVLLEGEPQKAFGESLSLFMELYDITTRMADILGNLLQQLNSVYSLRDKNVRPLNSIKNLILRTAFETFGEGLAVFLVLDEIIKQNEHIKSYLSLFSRMLNKVKLELDTFDITVEDIDLLDQVVGHFEKLLEVSFFQWVLYKESSWQGTMEQVKRNKTFIDGCFSCIHEGLLEIHSRLDTWKELPLDRWKMLQHMALFIFLTHASAISPEKKLGKVISDMIHLAPLIYVGGKRIILIDVLKEQCSPLLSSWSFVREVIRDRNVVNSNYLKRLTEVHSRDWQAMKDALSCWIVSFHSTIHPSAEMLSEGWLQLHLKKTMQGIVLANRLQLLILSILDLHTLLEVPIKREKLKSLCHMIVFLKVLEQIFQIRGPDLIRSLPHIINIIQGDIEQLILPSKYKLQVEVDKGSQISKLGFLSSLTRGGKETDTRLTDNLSLVHVSLQMLQGGGSHRRRIIFSNILDVLRSTGCLDINFSRVQKLTSKLGILANFHPIISNVTDCSFLYWRREMMGNLFSFIYADVRRSSWLQYLLDAFSDGVRLLKLGKVGKLTLETYEKEIEYGVKNEIVAPLCRDIETDLRLHVHSTYLKGSVVVNPTKTGVRNLAWYLEIKPLRLPFKFIDIRLLVESYLNSAFYNHSTMSTYDRKIYLEMQLLAELKYGLFLDNIHFVGNSMVHNIDIHEIVQHLHAFAENYCYNIIKQVFIEKVPKGQNKKNLRLIRVEDIANSISIHGQKGIYKASDAILKFLNEMFTTLSQLFQDNYSRTDSPNNCIFLKTDKEIVKGLPFLQQGEPRSVLGKLVLGDHGWNFLEQLHFVMIKMGNALGLVRIFQAGSSRHFSNISRFTTDLSFAENYQKLGFTDEILAAGSTMDKTIEGNYKPDGRMESFSVFISAFIKGRHFSEDDHMKDLFHIIPSIIVNFICSRVCQKDNLLLKERDFGSIVYMHDNFFMGVAFALKVLGQEKSFDQLNWFAYARKIIDDGMSSLEGSSKVQENSKVGSLARLKLWSQTPSIPVETQKDLDECKGYLKEIEYVEHVLNISRTLMS
ncbi:WASH complex subunit 7-like isoform X1 [Canna indica]|uniref:WASH complex subunit 7-like isoform X1 n=1 Tax=Canna indica TaxID=4628 RepID=A0AAQ3Q2D5_9LILI|nr:WASH complex subunit 7-like isoform X1 [Canna indica]